MWAELRHVQTVLTGVFLLAYAEKVAIYIFGSFVCVF